MGHLVQLSLNSTKFRKTVVQLSLNSTKFRKTVKQSCCAQVVTFHLIRFQSLNRILELLMRVPKHFMIIHACPTRRTAELSRWASGHFMCETICRFGGRPSNLGTGYVRRCPKTIAVDPQPHRLGLKAQLLRSFHDAAVRHEIFFDDFLLKLKVARSHLQKTDFIRCSSATTHARYALASVLSVI